MLYVDIFRIVSSLFTIYWYILFAYAIMGWVPGLNQTKLGQWVFRLSDPYVGLFRRFVKPLSLGGAYLDLSWIVSMIVLRLVQWAVLSILQQLLASMMSGS
jgi:YggT family protein